jgi:hypothetical protein
MTGARVERGKPVLIKRAAERADDVAHLIYAQFGDNLHLELKPFDFRLERVAFLAEGGLHRVVDQFQSGIGGLPLHFLYEFDIQLAGIILKAKRERNQFKALRAVSRRPLDSQ